MSSKEILTETGTNELEIIEFILNNHDRDGNIKQQSFGINVVKVREIIRMPKLTKLPNLPPNVYGVFNIRGTIIPALDLQKALYGIENNDKDRKMIIAEFNNLKIGFIVADVARIYRISWNDILSPQALEEFEEKDQTTSIIGFVQVDGKQLLMLDVEKIVADINPASAIGETNKDYNFDRHLKIFAVDDSETIRKMIHAKLQKAGFEITDFKDGEDAWIRMKEIFSEVRAGKKINDFVDLIITDVEMPKMDGYTLTKNIRSCEEAKNIPIIIFSSIINQDIMHKGDSVGATKQLSKPQIGDLIEIIKQLIEDKKV